MTNNKNQHQETATPDIEKSEWSAPVLEILGSDKTYSGKPNSNPAEVGSFGSYGSAS